MKWPELQPRTHYRHYIKKMDHESPEDYGSDAESIGEELDVKQESVAGSPSASTSGAAGGKGTNAKPANLQKRRRVTRACDECRRKKIKCDGKQPCTHCTVYSYGMFDLLKPDVKLSNLHCRMHV